VGTAALAVVAIPVGEVAFAATRRWRGHSSLMAGDRGHPYDRLVDRGWTRPAASLAYIGLEGVLVAAAVIAVHRRSMAASLAVDAVAAVLLLASAVATGALTPDRESRT